MSNIAGKNYAINVVTPISRRWRWVNRLVFFCIQRRPFDIYLKGLKTLSIVHYARWAVISPKQWPHLAPEQPKENLKYTYMLFFSNFNGSWTQYVDSFHKSIPKGLNMIWYKNLGYPKSVPLTPFHRYIQHNQIWTNHYYSAYPLASSNDVKSAQTVYEKLADFCREEDSIERTDHEFMQSYNDLLTDLQTHIARIQPTPIVSLAHQAVENRNIREA